MASEIRSGSGNVVYTNTTGQNVRVVINFMINPTAMSWSATGGGTVIVNASGLNSIGRNLAFYSPTSIANNASTASTSTTATSSLPTEVMISPGQTFGATCGSYNIIIIPEAG